MNVGATDRIKGPSRHPRPFDFQPYRGIAADSVYAGVQARGGQPLGAPDWPFDEPEITPFRVLLNGAIGGFIQYGEELTPAYRHASIDSFLDPAGHGQASVAMPSGPSRIT